MDILTVSFFIALIIEMIIRAPLNKKRRQEKMMLDSFGDQYQKYKQKVGGVIPKL